MRRAEQPERAHLGDDLAVEPLLAVGGEHAREQFVLRIAARGVAHHALFLGQLAFEIERVRPSRTPASVSGAVDFLARVVAGCCRVLDMPLYTGVRDITLLPLPLRLRCDIEGTKGARSSAG